MMTLHRWRKGLRAAPQTKDEAILQENRRLREIAANILIATQALKERYHATLGKQKPVETARHRSRHGQENPETSRAGDHERVGEAGADAFSAGPHTP